MHTIGKAKIIISYNSESNRLHCSYYNKTILK
jgi:hypothetical protein